MVFVTVRLFDATGSYASQRQQERLNGHGFRTGSFWGRMDEVNYRWRTFWNENVNAKVPLQDNNDEALAFMKKWTIEISGLDDRFATNFLDKFGFESRYPKMPLKAPDGLSYYVTITTDPNLARDGQVMPLSVASFYINKLEETGLRCTYTKHVGPDQDNVSPSMIWTLSTPL